METRSLISKRLEACKESDTLKGLLLNGAIDHLKSAVGEEPVNRILRELPGNESSFSSFFSYPMATFLQLVLRAMDLPGVPPDARAFMEWLGRGIARNVLDSPIAKTMALLSRNNPHGMLSASPGGASLVASFVERKYEKRGDRSAILHHRHDLFGGHCAAGLVSQAVESLTHVQVTTRVEPLNELETDFHLHFQW